jgi:predicted dithiol-disulfide oxidoreductase (DUF899 family)
MEKTSVLEKKISKAENEIMKKKESLAKLRRKLPRKKFQDFKLVSSNGKATSLSKLFGNRDELMVVHNMGQSCPYCALWADGFNGMLKHLENRVAFVVESPDAPAVQTKVLARQGWKFTMVSSQGSKFREFAGYEKDGDPSPGVSIFVRDKKGAIYQSSTTWFGPGDNYCSVWDLFDLLPKGANGWGAKFKY